ncbi:MAG: hypothetical protein MUO82_05315, partial [Candidatus Thermoplasmatota archaeon]|nr:hypothetical protein [Candidatus Thermoplasmatota archaeon]
MANLVPDSFKKELFQATHNFNTPAGNKLNMDLARVLAMKEIVEPLIDGNFEVLNETRAGLSYFSPNDDIAKGQLCASTLIQMSIKPH